MEGDGRTEKNMKEGIWREEEKNMKEGRKEHEGRK